MAGKGRTEKSEAQRLYDRIAEVQGLAMKVNGYRSSVAKYLRSLDLDIGPSSLVLDAGSGTGLVTLAFQEAYNDAGRIIALDLSINSLKLSREQFKKRKIFAKRTESVQGNVLRLPFADETFDLLLMCGVLEYTPLDDGLREASRVLKRDAPLVLLPVKPSIVGSVLELLYNFKIHPLSKVREAAERYFNIVSNHQFPITEPIAWSKTIYLLEKK